MRKIRPKRSRAPTTTADQAAADEVTAGSPAALPFYFPLRSLAASIPGGVETVVGLAWLSGDDQARNVVRRWASLSCQAKRKVELEEVCRAVGVDVGHFVGTVAVMAFELGLDVSDFVGAIDRPTEFVDPGVIAKNAALSAQFWRFAAFSNGAVPVLEKTSLARALGRRGPSSRIDRGARVVSTDERRSCRAMAAARRKWKLSQKQFAGLFFTSPPTVERWESRQFSPSLHQQWLLGLLASYAREHGMAAFRRRFVRQPPRYGKRGRPAGTREKNVDVYC